MASSRVGEGGKSVGFRGFAINLRRDCGRMPACAGWVIRGNLPIMSIRG